MELRIRMVSMFEACVRLGKSGTRGNFRDGP